MSCPGGGLKFGAAGRSRAAEREEPPLLVGLRLRNAPNLGRSMQSRHDEVALVLLLDLVRGETVRSTTVASECGQDVALGRAGRQRLDVVRVVRRRVSRHSGWALMNFTPSPLRHDWNGPDRLEQRWSGLRSRAGWCPTSRRPLLPTLGCARHAGGRRSRRGRVGRRTDRPCRPW